MLVVGTWLLLYAERLQVRITAWHESLKRTDRASLLFLKVTSMNYELPIRGAGAILVLGFLVMAIETAMHFERYHRYW